MNDKILDYIQRAIQEEAELEFEHAKEEMIKRLDAKKDEVIAGITLNIMKRIRMETMTNELVITVSTGRLKEL